MGLLCYAGSVAAEISVFKSIFPNSKDVLSPPLTYTVSDTAMLRMGIQAQEQVQLPDQGLYWGGQSFQTEFVQSLEARIPARLYVAAGYEREMAKVTLGTLHVRSARNAPLGAWKLDLGYPHAQIRFGNAVTSGQTRTEAQIRLASGDLAWQSQWIWENGIDSLHVKMDSVGEMLLALRERSLQNNMRLEWTVGSLHTKASVSSQRYWERPGTGISDSGISRGWGVAAQYAHLHLELMGSRKALVLLGNTNSFRPFLRQELSAQLQQGKIGWESNSWEVQAWGRRQTWSAPRNSIRLPSVQWNKLSESPLAPAASVIMDQRDWFYGSSTLQQWGGGGCKHWQLARTHVSPAMNLIWNEWEGDVMRRTLTIDYLFPRTNVDTLVQAKAWLLALEAQLHVRQELSPRWDLVGEMSFPIPLYAHMRGQNSSRVDDSQESQDATWIRNRAQWKLLFALSGHW